MATNLSLNAKSARALIEAAGLNASLPAAIFGPGAELLFANDRMAELLGEDLCQSYPVAVERIQTAWPFFNEDKAGPALFKSLLLTSPLKGASLTAELGLKTFRLVQKPAKSSGHRIVVAELLRSGDLLKDRESRQTLFRSLAHEIRTSVATLKGYTEMLEAEDENNKKVLVRMKKSFERLEKVVDRLTDFKTEVTGGEDSGL